MKATEVLVENVERLTRFVTVAAVYSYPYKT